MAWLPTWLQPWPASQSASGGALRDDREREQSLPASRQSSAPAPQPPQDTQTDLSPAPTAKAAGMDDAEERFFLHGPSLAIPMTGATLGFVAGFYTAAKKTGLIFMAENAHRRPDTVQGWYFYNKTKNYKVLLGGAQGGLRAGLRVGLWTLAYITIEEGVERARQSYAVSQGLDDAAWNGRWIDGGAAGLGIASGASLLYSLPGPIQRRVMGLGLLAGSSVGLLRQIQGQLAEAKLREAQQTTDVQTP